MATSPRDVMDRARLLFSSSGLSLDSLGLQMGYAPQTARKAAWQFLNRTNDPRLSMLARFAEALNISLADLVKQSRR
jgi:transcriptional regulator with XRE-family HTH domain